MTECKSFCGKAYEKSFQTILLLGLVAIGVTGFLLVCKLVHTGLPMQTSHAGLIAAVVAGASLIAAWLLSHRGKRQETGGITALSVLTVIGVVMVLATAYQMAAYIALPVDLLSFAESPFVNDILKLRLGIPVYTPPQDNNSYPYTPGAQILTYLIAKMFGHGDSIPFYRIVQFSYVIAASVVAVSVCHLLARRFLTNNEYRHRLLWMVVWFSFLFLIATDLRFNLYTHSLHNDGLALLFAVSAFWLLVRYTVAPRPWVLGFMVGWPTLGFLIKQSLLIWFPIFALYLLLASRVSWRQFMLFLLGSIMSLSVAIGVCYLFWGEPFLWWVFSGLGQKQVSLFRSMMHLLQAGSYAISGLLGGVILALRDGSRSSIGLWGCWLLLFGIEAYTSGVAWVANHLGPAVVIGACWFWVALIRLWPTAARAASWWQYRVQEAVAVCAMILLAGSLGLVRVPQNPVPSDFSRYVADIEREFEGLAPEKVLMDNGSWIYLRENILMKDRSSPVALHVGMNQPQINHAMLAATIKRIEEKTYDKILARQLDTDNSAYDYQDRGSGVKAAILANYREIRRIPEVAGITQWWPTGLVAEILVLIPNREPNGLVVSPKSASSTEMRGH